MDVYNETYRLASRSTLQAMNGVVSRSSHKYVYYPTDVPTMNWRCYSW